MFELFLKKRLIKKYAQKLPKDLKANYGLHRFYTKPQIDAAIERMRLKKNSDEDAKTTCYAYAMYCSPELFDDIYQGHNYSFDYQQLRDEIIQILAFDDDVLDFDVLLAASGYSGGVIATASLVKINTSKKRRIEHM